LWREFHYHTLSPIAPHQVDEVPGAAVWALAGAITARAKPAQMQEIGLILPGAGKNNHSWRDAR
jgi:hypothetical protein